MSMEVCVGHEIMKKILDFIGFWWRVSRAFSLGQTVFAAAVAVCVALNYPNFNIFYAFLAVIGVICAHLSVNLLDDYFDFVTGDVENRNNIHEGSRSDKCAAIQAGETTPGGVFICALVLGVTALLCGWLIFLQRGLPILVLAVVGAVLGFFYSAPPLKLSFHGLGEIIVGLMFGPLLMNGIFFSATGTISLQLLLLSVAIGSLVINILYVHSIMDVELDKKCGKYTLAGILPNKYFAFFAFLFFALYPYWVVSVGVYRFGMPIMATAVFLTLGLTGVLIKFMWETTVGSTKRHTPRFWMGPMENWKKIDEQGVGWFYIRWLLARNITMFFCLIICFVYLLEKIGV